MTYRSQRSYSRFALVFRSASTRFALMAVIAHEGTLTQGHYTAYIRGPDDVSRSGFNIAQPRPSKAAFIASGSFLNLSVSLAVLCD